MADQKLQQLEIQLKRIGCNYRFWGRAELRELAQVLFPDEVVQQCVNGSYEGGFALLVATNQRVLLIDKKPFYLTLEDVRFDMITEVDYNHRLLNASVKIMTPNKSLRFVGYNHDRLRQLFNFVQTKVMEIRQHYSQQLQPSANEVTAQPQLESQPSQYFAAQLPYTNQAPIPTPTLQPRSLVPQYRVPPIISAYTRLPLMSRQRRFLGSKAMNTPQPSIYR